MPQCVDSDLGAERGGNPLGGDHHPCILAGLPQGQEQSLSKPLISQSDARVCYCRHAKLAALDPLHTAIASLARIELHDRLPRADDFNGVRCIVVASPGPGDSLLPEIVHLCGQAEVKVPILHVGPGLEAYESENGIRQLPCPLPVSFLAQFIRDPG